MAKQTDNKWYKSWAFKQICLAVAAAFVTLVILFSLLRVITRHGQKVEVPQLTNMTYDEAQAVAKKHHLRLKIVDSVYVPQVAKGLIFKQNPAAGSFVKKRRHIMITINSMVPNMVRVPSLVGYSLRQAESNLNAAQLRIGKLIYVSDIATNNVLGQMYHGKSVTPGDVLPAESEIDLRLGLNPSDCQTYVPNLIGTQYQQVRSELVGNSLNLQRMICDGTVKSFSDSLQSIVYKQEPAPSSRRPVTMGTGVTVYMTLNKSLAARARQEAVKTENAEIASEPQQTAQTDSLGTAAQTDTESQTGTAVKTGTEQKPQKTEPKKTEPHSNPDEPQL